MARTTPSASRARPPGDRIDVPLFPRASLERVIHGSFWGNYTDLSEVMAIAAEGKIRHTIKQFGFEQINLLRVGEIVAGRL
jgi:alcohol dehydrogenase, propanol-preferring